MSYLHCLTHCAQVKRFHHALKKKEKVSGMLAREVEVQRKESEMSSKESARWNEKCKVMEQVQKFLSWWLVREKLHSFPL